MTNERIRTLMAEAYVLANMSPDPSTQVGAFLIAFDGQEEWLTKSYNRPSTGLNMSVEDWQHPTKLALVEHAERGALYRAAMYNICTAGSTMIATWACCSDCARGLVASGVTTLIRHVQPDDEATRRWSASVEMGDRILKDGGVEVVDIRGPIPDAPKILRSGQMFDPTMEYVKI